MSPVRMYPLKYHDDTPDPNHQNILNHNDLNLTLIQTLILNLVMFNQGHSVLGYFVRSLKFCDRDFISSFLKFHAFLREI